MAAQKGVRRPDYELEVSDSESYWGRICISDEYRDSPVVWKTLQGALDYYIASRFPCAEVDSEDD